MDSITLIACQLKSINYSDDDNLIELMLKEENEITNYSEMYRFSIENIEPDYDENHKVCIVELEIKLSCDENPVNISAVVNGIFAYLDTLSQEEVLTQCLSNLWPAAQDTLQDVCKSAGIIFEKKFDPLNLEECREIVSNYMNSNESEDSEYSISNLLDFDNEVF